MIILIYGHMGSGKTTIRRYIQQAYPNHYVLGGDILGADGTKYKLKNLKEMLIEVPKDRIIIIDTWRLNEKWVEWLSPKRSDTIAIVFRLSKLENWKRFEKRERPVALTRKKSWEQRFNTVQKNYSYAAVIADKILNIYDNTTTEFILEYLRIRLK